MLLALSLRNFVIVDQLNLNFESGFTTLTGETGAGKSIILDALGLLLGGKADYSQIRHGTNEAQLSALFDIDSLPQLQNKLEELGLSTTENELSIRRIIDIKGKSRNFINEQAVTLAQLKMIGPDLVDIHGQNAHQSLNKEATQRELLDSFAANDQIVAEVKQAFSQWQQAKKALLTAQNEAESLQIERERIEWQLNEFNQANLQENEWAELNKRHDTLAYAADILSAAQKVEYLIDEDGGIQSQLYQSSQNISSLAHLDTRFSDSISLLQSIEAELSEITANMRDIIADTEIDPNELEEQESRLQTLNQLARKYRLLPEDLLSYQINLQEQLDSLQAASDIQQLEKDAQQKENIYFDSANKLTKQRQKAATKLAQETTTSLQKLAMQGASFDIALLPCEPTSHGLEQIQYMVATNRGSELKPMHKVASGGELSRISLSLQVVTSELTTVPTLIFDEVDTGIGGRVAQVVGEALQQLGKRYQVLAITHLPQVAACGNQQWQVSKQDIEGLTVSTIKVLNQQDRIEEIARMLGGEIITETTKQHAKELLSTLGTD